MARSTATDTLLDATNRRILRALEENARISWAELGKRVHLSAPAVAERVRRMEAAGLIRGYRVDLDLDRVGYPIVALVECTVFRAREREFRDLVLATPEVVEVFNVTGEQAFIVRVTVPSMSRLDAVLERFCDLSDTNTRVVLSKPLDRVLPASFQSD